MVFYVKGLFQKRRRQIQKIFNRKRKTIHSRNCMWPTNPKILTIQHSIEKSLLTPLVTQFNYFNSDFFFQMLFLKFVRAGVENSLHSIDNLVPTTKVQPFWVLYWKQGLYSQHLSFPKMYIENLLCQVKTVHGINVKRILKISSLLMGNY